jgi:3',5'-cyclic AMP phosphodiesterase CpdA
VRFVAVGDTGTGGRAQSEVGRRMAELRSRWSFDTVILLGDNLYGSEKPLDYVLKFERPYQVLLAAGVKFYASLGNHDQDDQVRYLKFNMNGQPYYSFRKGDVEFFALNSKRIDRRQIAWLESRLQDSRAAWKIVFCHHPLYSSGRRHGSDLPLRRAIEPLLVRYGVQVAFAGHDHFYERLHPQQGVHYFVAGAGGKIRRDNIQPSVLTARGFDTDNSFVAVEIAGDELYFEAISRAGQIIDSGVIHRAGAEKAISQSSPEN